MKEKLTNTVKGILRLGLIGAILGSSIALSEKIGLTNVFVQYWDMQHQIYSKMDDHKLCNYPYEKNETDEQKSFRLRKYGVIADIEIGLVSLMCAGAVYTILEDKKYEKNI